MAKVERAPKKLGALFFDNRQQTTDNSSKFKVQSSKSFCDIEFLGFKCIKGFKKKYYICIINHNNYANYFNLVNTVIDNNI